MKVKVFFRNIGHIIVFVFVALSLKLGLLKSKSLYKRYISEPENFLEQERYEYVYKQVSKATFIANCKINVHGIEKVPNLPVMFVCNHKSGFDPLLLLKIFSKEEKLVRPVFVSKKELLDEKLIGKAAMLIDTIFIDRKNIRSAIKSLEEEKKVLSKRSIVVFIEGTRILEKEFGEFKSAALEPAYKTMRHIVPVVIHGSIGVEKENKKGFFKYKEINIKFMTPLKYNDFIPYSRDAISEKLKNSMFNEYMKFEEKNPLDYSKVKSYKKIEEEKNIEESPFLLNENDNENIITKNENFELNNEKEKEENNSQNQNVDEQKKDEEIISKNSENKKIRNKKEESKKSKPNKKATTKKEIKAVPKKPKIKNTASNKKPKNIVRKQNDNKPKKKVPKKFDF